MFTWLRSSLVTAGLISSARRPIRRRGVQLGVEALENRATPTVVTWTGAAGLAWSDDGNWSGNQKPAIGDDLVFPPNPVSKVNFNDFGDGRNFGSITIQGSSYVLEGHRIDLRRPGEVIVATNSSGTNTINLDINLGFNNGTSEAVIKVNSAASTLVINGVMDGGDFTNVLTVGAGTLVLNAANTFKGRTDVGSGTLSIRNGAALGQPGGTSGTAFLRGVVELRNNISVAEEFSVRSGGGLRSASGNNTITGEFGLEVVTIDGTSFGVAVDEGSRLTIAGDIHGPVPAIKSGEGELVLSGANSYTGAMTVAAGQLTIQNNTALGSVLGGTKVLAGAVLAGSGVRNIFEFVTLDGADVAGGPAAELTALNGSNITWGGGVTLAGNTIFRAVGSGRLKLNTELNVSGDVTVTGGVVLNGLTPSIAGGTVEVAGPTLLSGAPRLALGGGATLKVTGGMHGNANLAINAGPLPGGGTVVFAGPGPFTHTGFINHNAGTVEVDAALASGGISSAVGTTLRGTGSIANILANGTVDPGAGAGTAGRLTITNDFTAASTTTFRADLFGTTPASGHDQLRVSGRINLTQIPILSVQPHSSFAFGDSFRIIDNVGPNQVEGTFAGLPTDGSTFTVSTGFVSQKFEIFYHGGDGNDVVIKRANTATLAPGIAVTPTVQEGQVVHLTGHLVDPDPRDRLTLVVNWGDGSKPQTFHPGTRDFDITHRYLDNGHYVVHASWFDNHGAGNSRDLAVTVTNVDPVLSGIDVRFAGNQVFISGRITDPGRDSFTLVIHWGDGQSSTYQFKAGTDRFQLSHRYQSAGNYRVGLEITDDDGGADAASLQVRVRAREAWLLALADYLADLK